MLINASPALRLLEMAGSGTTPPPDIIRLQEEIAGKIRVAELHTSLRGAVDPEEVHEIVGLRLELDRRIAAWVMQESGS